MTLKFGLSKFDSSQIEQKIVTDYQFTARLYQKCCTTDGATMYNYKRIDLLVELIHCADWSQFFFIEDNPRLFLCISPMNNMFIELEPQDYVLFELYIHYKPTGESLCLFQRYFSPSEYSESSYQYDFNPDTYPPGLDQDTVEANGIQYHMLEKSFGSNKTFSFQVLKQTDSSVSHSRQNNGKIRNELRTKFYFHSLKHHFSLWTLYEKVCTNQKKHYRKHLKHSIESNS
jgi:hypothetical protein